MKILHINDYNEFWWAEIVFNNIYNEIWWEKLVLNDFISKNIIIRNFQNFFISFKIYFELKKIVKKNNITHILLHNYNLSPLTILFYLNKNINSTQIIHACWQIWCPSSWWVYRKNFNKCSIVSNYNKCRKMCAYDKNLFLFSYYYFWNKFIVNLRKKKVNKFISPSIAMSNLLIKNWFENINILLNKINYKVIVQEKKENIFLYVWSIDKRKWIDKLLEIVDELSFLKNDWKFIIIWSWNELNNLKNKYRDTFYTFLGNLSNEKVIEYYSKSKILFVPSILFETFWLVALEWIFYNNIVLGTNIWWIPEIIGEKNIINIFDKKDVQNKITDFLENYDIYYKNFQTIKKHFFGKNKLYIQNLLEIIKK
jgi:glycosyltransferase involved in cell wall biosynthesis